MDAELLVTFWHFHLYIFFIFLEKNLDSFLSFFVYDFSA